MGQRIEKSSTIFADSTKISENHEISRFNRCRFRLSKCWLLQPQNPSQFLYRIGCPSLDSHSLHHRIYFNLRWRGLKYARLRRCQRRFDPSTTNHRWQEVPNRMDRGIEKGQDWNP